MVCDPVEGTLTLYSKDFVVWLERVLASDISDEQRVLLEFLVVEAFGEIVDDWEEFRDNFIIFIQVLF